MNFENVGLIVAVCADFESFQAKFYPFGRG